MFVVSSGLSREKSFTPEINLLESVTVLRNGERFEVQTKLNVSNESKLDFEITRLNFNEFYKLIGLL